MAVRDMREADYARSAEAVGSCTPTRNVATPRGALTQCSGRGLAGPGLLRVRSPSRIVVRAARCIVSPSY